MRWMLPLVMIVLPVCASAQDASPLSTPKGRLSYALGMDLGAQMKARSVDLDPAVFARGLMDALSGGKALLNDVEVKAIVAELQQVMMAKQAEAAKAAASKAKAEGDAFLAANKTKDGVVTLPSGLQYTIMTAGTGKKPTIDDTVVCHYKGMLLDGKEVDSSYTRKEPLTFAVKNVIKGWTEALLLMPAGSKWRIVVPSNLAYGEAGRGQAVPPNTTLIFEIELVAIK